MVRAASDVETMPSSVTPADLERPARLPRLTDPEDVAALINRFRAALAPVTAGGEPNRDARDGLVSEYARVLLEVIRY